MAEPTFTDVAHLTDALFYCGVALRSYKVLQIEDLFSRLVIKFPRIDHEQFQTMVLLMYRSGLVITDKPGTMHRSIRWIGAVPDFDTQTHLFIADTLRKTATLRDGVLVPRCTLCGRLDVDPIHLK